MTFRTLMEIRENLMEYLVILEKEYKDKDEVKNEARGKYLEGEMPEEEYDKYYETCSDARFKLLGVQSLIREIEDTELK